MSDGVEKDLYMNQEVKVINEIRIERVPAVRRKKRSKGDSFVIYLDYIYHYHTNSDYARYKSWQLWLVVATTIQLINMISIGFIIINLY